MEELFNLCVLFDDLRHREIPAVQCGQQVRRVVVVLQARFTFAAMMQCVPRDASRLLEILHAGIEHGRITVPYRGQCKLDPHARRGQAGVRMSNTSLL